MITLLTGDVREVLPTLPDASVQCVVTSPPYYGLRDYGTAQWEGGDAGCQHTLDRRNDRPWIDGCTSWTTRDVTIKSGGDCPRCGARRIDAQIGLEPTPEAFIAELVAVFREVKRVLRNDGVMFVNLGDSYAGTKVGNTNGTGASSLMADGRDEASRLHSLSLTKTIGMQKPAVDHGLAAKQLLMMPARVALALQADGWWLRSDIIWAKPNPMPESCRDRPTSAHEHVFLLTKRSRYYYDADAVREERIQGEDARTFRGDCYVAGEPGKRGIVGNDYVPLSGGRNLRNVWSIATAPFPAAHFATFPPELADRCIRAGTSERGACAACGAPWVRTTEQELHRPPAGGTTNQKGPRFNFPRVVETATIGWSPSCQCNAETRPCVVLDPFSGAGTALLVADRLGRDSVGIDLSHQYVEMARERLRADCPLFAEISDAPVPEPPEDERMSDLFAEMEAAE